MLCGSSKCTNSSYLIDFKHCTINRNHTYTQSILLSIRKAVFDTLVGTDWIGVRVRAATHRIILPGEPDTLVGEATKVRYGAVT